MQTSILTSINGLCNPYFILFHPYFILFKAYYLSSALTNFYLLRTAIKPHKKL
jgi:hypothetical protein